MRPLTSVQALATVAALVASAALTPMPASAAAGGSTPPTTATQATSPPVGSPVARHGQLRVAGTALVHKNNARVQLRGVSSSLLRLDTTGYARNLSALTWMRDNWNLQVIRAAMAAGAYLQDPTKYRRQVERIINNAVSAGVYVIVDWQTSRADLVAHAALFFADMAARFGHLPNVIWEPWSAPRGGISWEAIKLNHTTVVTAIRAVDPDNIIVLGTRDWSGASGANEASDSPMSGTNLMYTLQFYSCLHRDGERFAFSAAAQKIPLFVTEWGATSLPGTDGRYCEDEARKWLQALDARHISWAAYQLGAGTDPTHMLAPGAPVTGGWTTYLRGHGPYVVNNMR